MKKIHIGCGNNYIDSWINIDISEKYKTDINLDVRNKLPFWNNSVDFIYSEHFIEHLTFKESISFLKECKRILKNNGIMRISTPNLEKMVSDYYNNNLIELNGWKPKTLCDMVNEWMRNWGHKYIYDFDKIEKILKNIGFVSIKKCDHGKSDYKELNKLESRSFNDDLIVECKKK